MNSIFRSLFILLASFMTFACGGGSGKTSIELGGDDVEVGVELNYNCASDASSIEDFSLSPFAIPADFSKKTGLDLKRYFYYITTDQEDDSNIEVRNKYKQRYEKHYLFGQAPSFEITEFDPFVVQSLRDSWYFIGGENNSNSVSPYAENDDDIPRYAFEPAEFIDRVNVPFIGGKFVGFAEFGDTVGYTNTDDLSGEIVSSCEINNKYIPVELEARYEGDVISLTCKNYMMHEPDPDTGDQLFVGSKGTLYLAENIGIVSVLQDGYQSIINNGRESQRRCFQSFSELIETKTVPRDKSLGL